MSYRTKMAVEKKITYVTGNWAKLAFCEYGKDPIVFEGITEGTIATEKSGQHGWSWDFAFIPKGENKTLGCFPDEERWNFWNLDSYKKLAKYIEKI